MTTDINEIKELLKNLGETISRVGQEIQALIQKEIELFKVELSYKTGRFFKGIIFIAVAAGLGFFATIFLLLTLVFVLSIWLPLWAAAAVVTAILLIGAGAAAFIAIGRLSAGSPMPTIAMGEAKETVDWAKKQVKL